MSESIPSYDLYLPKGQRVQLKIPRTDAPPFIEWGVVYSLTNDLLELRLSRDRLPSGLMLGMGMTIELRIIRDGTLYGCRVLVVDEPEQEFLRVRLVGDILNCDLREYFRIDAYLPVRYAVPGTSDKDLIRQLWLKRREQAAGTVTESGISLSHSVAAGSTHVGGTAMAAALPVAANISGGGIKVNLPEHLVKDDFLLIQIYLPANRLRLVEITGRVISSEKLFMPDGSPPLYQTSIAFHLIDERERDALIQYITTEQIRRLRSMQPVEASSPVEPSGSPTIRTYACRTLVVVTALYISFSIARFYYNYYSKGHKPNQIATIFQGGIQQYLEKLRQFPPNRVVPSPAPASP